MPAPSRSLSVMRYVSLHSATSARILSIWAFLESTMWNCGTFEKVVSMSFNELSSCRWPNVAAHTYLSAPKWPTMVLHFAGDSTIRRILFLLLFFENDDMDMEPMCNAYNEMHCAIFILISGFCFCFVRTVF